MTSNFIAIDLGAESGRLVRGTIENEHISLEELHRFNTQGTEVRGHLYWNVLRFYEEILAGFRAGAAEIKAGTLKGIGVDTWGVDFAILDRDGNLSGLPYHYRDREMNEAFASLFDVFTKEEIYEITGIQFLSLNTIVKLHALVRGGHPCIQGPGKTLLMMPDYFNYLLTGEMASEYTEASTSQLLNARTRSWHVPFIEELGLDPAMFQPTAQPCNALGSLLPSIAGPVDALKDVPVHLIGSHDTASAVAGTPLVTARSAYLSSGTWSLLGMELPGPVISNDALAKNFTNEGGVGDTIRFLKNIAGLWLLQQSKAAWEERTGDALDYGTIVNEARKVGISGSIINPDDPRFFNPSNMLDEIRDACLETAQVPPRTIDEFASIIFTSLALRYRQVIGELESLTGTSIDYLHVVGGGSKNTLLCQYTSSATNLPVCAGPDEATSLGNIIAQAISAGMIDDLAAGRRIIANSVIPVEFEPVNPEIWDKINTEKYIPYFIENKR
jgi:rhamnulokinase